MVAVSAPSRAVVPAPLYALSEVVSIKSSPSLKSFKNFCLPKNCVKLACREEFRDRSVSAVLVALAFSTILIVTTSPRRNALRSEYKDKESSAGQSEPRATGLETFFISVLLKRSTSLVISASLGLGKYRFSMNGTQPTQPHRAARTRSFRFI